ncbi:MAG: NAD(P)/FAD-dependent oxidoreductase [Caldimonas sp.]
MTPIATDTLIVGAGPVGLFQVFELGLLEVTAQVVDSLPHAGGQCLELYADKPIYDIPALARCTGRELVERLQQQIAPFATGFHLAQQVSRVALRDDGGFDVGTDAGTRFVAKTIVVAGGVGSFQPRRLKVEGLDRWRDTQVLYGRLEAARAGQRIVIAGAGEAAVAAALFAAPSGAASVTLVHRRDDFEADTDSLARLAEARAAGRVGFVAGQASALAEVDGRLSGLVVSCNDGSTRTLPLDVLQVLLGWSPKLGPISDWGMALERKQIVVDTERFETSVPGIHAVGDINTYAGKRKLIVSGFHEATLAAYAIAERIHPERAQPLLYTTTSPKLHTLLGVRPEG